MQPATINHQRLPINDRAQLIEVGVVRAMTGLRRDEIYDRVDGSSLLSRGLTWVFNMAANPGGDLRDLRFWAAEIQDLKDGTSKTAQLKIEDVVNRILPRRAGGRAAGTFHSGELITMFALSRPSLAALRDELNGNLVGARNVLFQRENVAAFLRRRWLGQRDAVTNGASPKARGGLTT